MIEKKAVMLFACILAIILLSGCVEKPECPESCDDADPCTSDFCSEETNFTCAHTLIKPCCGNKMCEVTETYSSCPNDCPNCDDYNECTTDSFDYNTQKCVNAPIENCCGNGICELGEDYTSCSKDCPNCDDDNNYTLDSYDYHAQKCVNKPIFDVIYCGNDICETGETYENCARDCPNCDDGNECTTDSYDYHEQKCINELIIPCCGNGICEEDAETYLNCPADCPNCDDDDPFTEDRFNYETQKCEHTPMLELKEGFKYVYETARCPGCSKLDSSIYVTKETSKYWEGIAGVKIDDGKKAYLMRWRIYKDNLDISMTLPLTKDALLGDVDYISDIKQIEQLGEAGNSILPFWMVIINEMGGLSIDELITTHRATLDVDPQQNVTISTSDPALYGKYLAYTLDVKIYKRVMQKETGEFVIEIETVEFVMSAAEPYLMMKIEGGEGPRVSFKRVEQKEFSLDDYAGYSIGEWTPG